MKRSSQAGAYNQSRVKLFLRCRRAYYYRYDYPVVVMGKKGNVELTPIHSALPLKKGSWLHELLAAYWLQQAGIGRGWEARHCELATEFSKLFEEERAQYGDLPEEAYRLFRGYLRRWRDDEGKFRVAQLASGDPAVEFVIEVPLDRWGVSAPFKGRVDILVEDLEYGGLWIRDAKWVRGIPGPDERMMSPQNIMYVWALRKLGYDVRGFIYDYGRTKTPTEPAILKSGFVTTRQSMDCDVSTYLRQMVKAHGKKGAKQLARTYYKEKLAALRAREATWYVRERIPVQGPRVVNGFKEFILACREIEKRNIKNPVRTYLYNCHWNCAYHEPCVAEFQGLDVENLFKQRFEVVQETYAQEEIE